jgi:hypothetical protein
MIVGPNYFFLAAAGLAFAAGAAVTATFFWLTAVVFVCFCVAFFCTDFGDLSPMVGILLLS